MPIRINGEIYYRSAEVCRIIGISRTTLFRWLKEGTFEEARYRDRRGWRLFTKDEMDRFRLVTNHLVENHQSVTPHAPTYLNNILQVNNQEKDYV